MIPEEWILYKIREDTVLKNNPLYCPKCKQETWIEVTNFQITVIKEPGANAFRNKGMSGAPLTTNPPFGYLKNPENPKEWFVDEPVAMVVSEIVLESMQRVF